MFAAPQQKADCVAIIMMEGPESCNSGGYSVYILSREIFVLQMS